MCVQRAVATEAEIHARARGRRKMSVQDAQEQCQCQRQPGSWLGGGEGLWGLETGHTKSRPHIPPGAPAAPLAPLCGLLHSLCFPPLIP